MKLFEPKLYQHAPCFAISDTQNVLCKIYSFQLYKEMQADFKNKFNANSFGQPKIHNKFVYVQGMTTAEINSQLKKAAKAAVNLENAKKTHGSVSKVVGPVVNALYTGRYTTRTRFLILQFNFFINFIAHNDQKYSESMNQTGYPCMALSCTYVNILSENKPRYRTKIITFGRLVTNSFHA